jgi:hypothetical protein
MASSAFAAMRIAPVASSTSPRNAAPPPQSCQPMTTPLMTTHRASRIGIVARASADDDGPKAPPSRRVARRAPKTKTTEEGGGWGDERRCRRAREDDQNDQDDDANAQGAQTVERSEGSRGVVFASGD